MPEPKSEAYWSGLGYRFFDLTSCPACGGPISVWEPPSGHMISLDPMTLETHFSSCPKAKEHRTELKLKEGVL